jgi:transcriptional regulator of acetoin/glycerol metabolism
VSDGDGDFEHDAPTLPPLRTEERKEERGRESKPEPIADGRHDGAVRARTISEMRAASSDRPKETLSRHRRDERDRILQALQSCNWNRVQAAKLSGIPRRTFYRRLREYGIQ